MKILQLAVPEAFGDISMKEKTPYVMSDPIAQQIANKHRGAVQKFEIFEPHYKPYIGQNLDNKKVAIWRTGGFGDLLFITPIVEYFKRKYPTCKVSVATSERFRDVWRNNPNIDKFTSSYSLPIKLDFVKKHDYVGIFEGTIENFKGNSQYCAIDAFAFNLGIFDMPKELKRPRYYLKSVEINAAKNKVRSKTGFDIYKNPYICFQWKSSSLLRDYPYEKLVATMYRLQQLTGYKIVILTHPNYRQLIEHEINMAMTHVIGNNATLDYVNLAGVTAYRESAAVLALSTGLVGIDSSLAHLAAALGVPSVTIYGPFKAEWRTVYNQNNISLQNQEVCPSAPCAYHTQPGDKDGLPYDLCTSKGEFPQYEKDKFCRVMESISVDEITDSFMSLMALQKAEELPIEREFKCKM
jgi:ADP-heptose:LPS heptosyltransferase